MAIRSPRALASFLCALLLAAMLGAGAPGASAAEDGPFRGAKYSEHYFDSGDGLTKLHADVLRPKGLGDKVRTPVILTVSPYLNHSGSTTDYSPSASGPSERFYDFLDLSNILERGYTYVMVDLPGYGGSGGCNDWGGPVEQGAVKAAVEWAASQPWSNGRVGMIGKSYDAWTGLMGIAQDPKGLEAVVAMEPVYSGYRYLYNNGVRFVNSLLTPAGFQAYDAKPGSTQDSPEYQLNGAPLAYCYGLNYALQQQDDDQAPHWVERDLIPMTKGSDIPLFLTQGFLETNTKPDGAFDLFAGMKGPKRAWFGQFDHVRGWERAGGGYTEGRFQTGRKDFVVELMRFFDEHLKGGARGYAADPNVAVQDNLGRYRGEASWPPSDSDLWWTKLRAGSYLDDGANSASGSQAGNGLWSISPTLDHDVWLAGEPVLTAEVDSAPRANLVANVYDIAPDGEATVVSRGATLLREEGSKDVRLPLYGQDWVFEKGHRVGVLISSANSDWWVHVPTNTDVLVNAAQIGLPFLRYDRRSFLPGGSTPRLEQHLESEVLSLSKQQVKDRTKPFDLPGPLRARS
jgi:predicted acyl esterase